MNNIKLPTKRDMVSILGKDFFKEETICDYLVSEKTKKTWAVNMDIYLEFAQICEKNNLKYYAYGGTLLGAIRHKGFIPWDDDMDVCMPREDYEKFLTIARKELSEPYFLQTPFTEPGYYRTYARVSNMKTTRILPFYKNSGISHGLMLDIFPLDDCIPEDNEQDIIEIFAHAKRCSQYLKRNNTDIMTPEHYESWKKYMTNEPMKEWEAVQRIAMKDNNRNTDYYCMKVVVFPGLKYNTPVKKELFKSVKKVEFEKIKVQIPSGYDGFLTATYGDYMEFPPVEKRGEWHGGLIIDPERPYTDYL